MPDSAMFRVVIPARYGSMRLPGKPLQVLAGKPMIQWVHEAAQRSGARSVTVATDDERIAAAARGFGADVALTSPTHASGTDRIAEVAATAGWRDQEVLVNLQGDEPLMPPALIRQVAALLERHRDADLATLATPLQSVEGLLDPNVVKVVADRSQRALYFSRAPIPWDRDGAAAGIASQARCEGACRHIGLYAYRVAALRRVAALPPSRLESIERLEQLRALENGMDIRVELAVEPPGPDVNTAADLALVERQLAAR